MYILKSKISNVIAIVSIFAVSICLFSNDAFAQAPQQQQEQEVRTDFDDEELEGFAEIAQEVQMVQQQHQQEINNAIEEEGISVERFNEMFQAMQNPEVALEATPEEEEAFDEAMAKVYEAEEALEEKVAETVEEGGLTMEEYNEIMTAYQQDPEIQERINELLRQQQ